MFFINLPLIFFLSHLSWTQRSNWKSRCVCILLIVIEHLLLEKQPIWFECNLNFPRPMAKQTKTVLCVWNPFSTHHLPLQSAGSCSWHMAVCNSSTWFIFNFIVNVKICNSVFWKYWFTFTSFDRNFEFLKFRSSVLLESSNDKVPLNKRFYKNVFSPAPDMTYFIVSIHATLNM